jgi:hypothetical protein
MTTEIRRHGDVLIKTNKEFSIPKGLKLKPIKILHKGENHDHYFSKGDVVVGEKDGKRMIRVKKSAIISHGRGASSEHESKPVPVGDYWVEIQTEYDHLLEESRQVID